MQRFRIFSTVSMPFRWLYSWSQLLLTSNIFSKTSPSSCTRSKVNSGKLSFSVHCNSILFQIIEFQIPSTLYRKSHAKHFQSNNFHDQAVSTLNGQPSINNCISTQFILPSPLPHRLPLDDNKTRVQRKVQPEKIKSKNVDARRKRKKKPKIYRFTTENFSLPTPPPTKKFLNQNNFFSTFFLYKKKQTQP